jgi:flagellar biosynthesis/type III secretory pathway protein FliH
MNLPSDGNAVSRSTQGVVSDGVPETMAAFLVPETRVSPFEFRLLTQEGGEVGSLLEVGRDAKHRSTKQGLGNAGGRGLISAMVNCESRLAALQNAVDTARHEGFEQGDREGRRAMRAEMDAEMQATVIRERQHVVEAVSQFHAMRERYFAEVEQEVVKLALGIAGRVLHREAQLDPLLLAGVVRVALEKMADRSGVVLRVSSSEADAWVQMFQAEEEAERPRVAEDARLARGECVLETRMGTVELGVAVQLEEIEKGFFDLLNHRPAE